MIDGFDSSNPFNSLFETPSAILVPSPIIRGIFIVWGREAMSILSSDFLFFASLPDGVGARCDEDANDERDAGREFDSACVFACVSAGNGRFLPCLCCRGDGDGDGLGRPAPPNMSCSISGVMPGWLSNAAGSRPLSP